MSKKVYLNVLSIDQHIYELIKMHGAKVIGVYQNTMHLILNQNIITLGTHIKKAKHHILFDDAFKEIIHMVKVGDKAVIDDDALFIGNLHITILDDAVKPYQPYNKRFENGLIEDHLLNTLQDLIENTHAYNLYNYPKDNPWTAYQFKKIQMFLEDPNLYHAEAILGLGVGLTPLGDDILTGYILGLNTINQSLPWVSQIIARSTKKTSLLSAQSLLETYERYYPEIIIEMIEDVCINHNIDQAKALLNLGSTSGAAILTGFIHGVKRGSI